MEMSLSEAAEDGEEMHWTLTSDPEPWPVYQEPLPFAVTVHATKGVCDIGHQAGDRRALRGARL